MVYTSTRDASLRVSSAQAVCAGISAEGGLFVPCEIPSVSLDFINSLTTLDYKSRADKILALFMTDFSEEEISKYTEGAYGDGKFSSSKIAPLTQLNDRVNVLELWRGPTCAFKDMALQLLPYFLTGAAEKVLDNKEIVILVATSGDTGKAALEGFCDVNRTKIIVFYPDQGVSPMQQLQMCTQSGSNVGVCAVRGNFDDAQNGVKAIFTDEKVKEKFAENNLVFSSANSINWGRLVPQIVYYFSAYADMLYGGSIALGDKINITVPTGNFGNILAAYYAKIMGLPVNRLICASNKNNILTDFIKTGKYDKNRQFFNTISPSMDILISSNLERLLFNLYGNDADAVIDLQNKLKLTGEYTISENVYAELNKLFDCGCCNDIETKETIADVFKTYNYLIDTHTAVGVKVYNDYFKRTGDTTPVIIASTANPYKFSRAVLEAVTGDSREDLDEFGTVVALEEYTGVHAPKQLAQLKGKPVRFSNVCGNDSESMRNYVFEMLNIK